MTVNNWFTNGCNYQEGVIIYAGLKNSKANLLRLFKLKESNYNKQKLKYELSKFKEVAIAKTVITEVSNTPGNTAIPPKAPKPSQEPTYKPLLIRDLPIELHPTFIQQKKDYATVCSLKMQLNNVGPEENALGLCLQIESLFDAIEAAWKILDHYTDTKTILKVATNNFTELTPPQLLLRRNSKRSSLTKANKLITKYKNTDTTKLNVSQKTKLAVNLERQQLKVIQLEKDINALNELINT